MKERKMGKGRVGIDIGTSTIAAVSEADMVFKELNDGIESIDAEIRRLIIQATIMRMVPLNVIQRLSIRYGRNPNVRE